MELGCGGVCSSGFVGLVSVSGVERSIVDPNDKPVRLISDLGMSRNTIQEDIN